MMGNIISDAVRKLSAVIDLTPIDWDAFDAIHNDFLKRNEGDQL